MYDHGTICIEKHGQTLVNICQYKYTIVCRLPLWSLQTTHFFPYCFRSCRFFTVFDIFFFINTPWFLRYQYFWKTNHSSSFPHKFLSSLISCISDAFPWINSPILLPLKTSCNSHGQHKWSAHSWLNSLTYLLPKRLKLNYSSPPFTSETFSHGLWTAKSQRLALSCWW